MNDQDVTRESWVRYDDPGLGAGVDGTMPDAPSYSKALAEYADTLSKSLAQNDTDQTIGQITFGLLRLAYNKLVHDGVMVVTYTMIRTWIPDPTVLANHRVLPAIARNVATFLAPYGWQVRYVDQSVSGALASRRVKTAVPDQVDGVHFEWWDDYIDSKNWPESPAKSMMVVGSPSRLQSILLTWCGTQDWRSKEATEAYKKKTEGRMYRVAYAGWALCLVGPAAVVLSIATPIFPSKNWGWWATLFVGVTLFVLGDVIVVVAAVWTPLSVRRRKKADQKAATQGPGKDQLNAVILDILWPVAKPDLR
jgi:hypothetical protein